MFTEWHTQSAHGIGPRCEGGGQTRLALREKRNRFLSVHSPRAVQTRQIFRIKHSDGFTGTAKKQRVKTEIVLLEQSRLNRFGRSTPKSMRNPFTSDPHGTLFDRPCYRL